MDMKMIEICGANRIQIGNVVAYNNSEKVFVFGDQLSVRSDKQADNYMFVEMPTDGTGAAITLDDEIYFAIQKMRMDYGRMSIKNICYNLVREGLIARGYLK